MILELTSYNRINNDILNNIFISLMTSFLKSNSKLDSISLCDTYFKNDTIESLSKLFGSNKCQNLEMIEFMSSTKDISCDKDIFSVFKDWIIFLQSNELKPKLKILKLTDFKMNDNDIFNLIEYFQVII